MLKSMYLNAVVQFSVGVMARHPFTFINIVCEVILLVAPIVLSVPSLIFPICFVNVLLFGFSADHKHVEFDFLVRRQFLRSSLASHMETENISTV